MNERTLSHGEIHTQRKSWARKPAKSWIVSAACCGSIPPVTKMIESKKLCNRKKKTHARYDEYGMGFCSI